MSQKIMMETKKLNKSFHFPVIKDLDFTVQRGDLILIQGANGCGKSTLLKIISGIMKPDQGEVVFYEPYKIGALIENPNFIENETALYNMKFLIELTTTFDIGSVQKYFEMFNLNIRDKTRVKKYSVGMRQKLGIIQAVMEDQNFILFDEPTRGLDRASVAVFENLIHTLNKIEGKTCIICAHDGVQGIKFNRILEMDDGKLIEESYL